MKLVKPIIIFGTVFYFLIPTQSNGEKKGAFTIDTSTIATGIRDSIKTSLYIVDSIHVHQEALISKTGRKIGFTISQSTKDTACNLEIKGSANRVYGRMERGCPSPFSEKESYQRYLGKKKDCMVEIMVMPKWLTYSTSNCEHNPKCPTSSIKPLKFSRDSIVTRWVTLPQKNILVPSR
jgi:hypothetical protein